MAERPIACPEWEVRAFLSGTKTQLRRLLPGSWKPGIERSWLMACRHRAGDYCPFGGPGDRLWVKEPWAGADKMYRDNDLDPPQAIAYPADRSAVVFDDDLKPHQVPKRDLETWNWDALKVQRSILMPRWAARLILEIVHVKVEPINYISEEDARAEGVVPEERAYLAGNPWRDAFAALWDQSNKRRAPWFENPWVWALTVKRLEG